MKSYLPVALLLFGSLYCNAQAPRRSFVAFSILAPIPTGQYGSSDPEGENPLLAKTGMGLGIEGAFMFHPYIGVGGMVTGISNRFDDAEFNSFLKDGYNNQFPVVSATTESSSHWVQASMLGIYGSLPLKRISVDAKLLGGLFSYQFPSIRSVFSNGEVEFVHKVNADKATSFGINAGVGARMQLTNHLMLRATVDYLQGNVEATLFQSATYTNGRVIGTNQSEQSFTISMINLGIGLAYQINNEK